MIYLIQHETAVYTLANEEKAYSVIDLSDSTVYSYTVESSFMKMCLGRLQVEMEIDRLR